MDLDVPAVTCPAGHTQTRGVPLATGALQFQFRPYCEGCPLRDACTSADNGRTLAGHTKEKLLQTARTYQQTPQGKAHLRERVAVEHALAGSAGWASGRRTTSGG